MAHQPTTTGAPARRLATMIFAIGLALSSVGGESAQAQRGGALDLEELELSEGRRRGQLALHYALARHARPDVQLHVSVDRARRGQDLVANLDHQRGWIPLGRTRGPVAVSVRATDRSGRSIPLRLGRGLLVSAVELSSEHLVERAVVERHWGAPPRRRAVRVDGPPEGGAPLGAVADACDRAFVGSDAEAECLRLMRGVPRAEAIVAACDRAFVGEDAALRCVQARPRPRVVAACDRMFVGDDSLFRCVDIVDRSHESDHEIDEVFEVCGRRVGESDELACLDQMLSPRRRGRRRR